MRTMFANRKIDPDNLSDVSINAPISAQPFRNDKLPPSEKEELVLLRFLMQQEIADLKAERPTSRAANCGAMLSGRGRGRGGARDDHCSSSVAAIGPPSYP